MVADILLSAITPIGSGKPSQNGRADVLRLLPQLQPGDLLSAQVEAKLPDGTFKVVVAGQTLRMELPDTISPGETLELEFVAREPRLAFVLKGVLEAASAPLLSETGRLVAALMPQTGEATLPLPASSAAPVLAAPPEDGAELSRALQQTLAESGLFYEAHQAEWLAGKRERAQLLAEPQARLAPEASAPGKPIPEQALPIVQHQLTALDTAGIALRLEIWPGQWMRWEIDEDSEYGAHEPNAATSWNTLLRLELPQLGQLNAALTLGARGLDIRIDADEPASAALLQEHRASLHQALAAAGVPPLALEIRRHGPD